jgi:hypothetical protein
MQPFSVARTDRLDQVTSFKEMEDLIVENGYVRVKKRVRHTLSKPFCTRVPMFWVAPGSIEESPLSTLVEK